MFIKIAFQERFGVVVKKVSHKPFFCNRINDKSSVVGYHRKLKIDTAYLRLSRMNGSSRSIAYGNVVVDQHIHHSFCHSPNFGFMVKKSSVKVGKIQFHLISPITIYIYQYVEKPLVYKN